MDLWLFLKAVFSHWIATLGLLLTITPLVPRNLQRWLERKIVKDRFSVKHLWTIGAFLLLVAFYQAWLDEHRNVQLVITEKAAFASEREFWKDQSYQKDSALRQRDELLTKNVMVLGETQQAFASLSNKILEVTKPESLAIRTTQNVIPIQPKKGRYLNQMVVFTNKAISPVRVVVSCPFEVGGFRAWVAGTGTMMGTNDPPLRDRHSAEIRIGSPVWSPASPLLITVYHNDPRGTGLCEVKQS